MKELCAFCIIFFQIIIVSATRRRRDIKILLSVGIRSEKFNIVSNDHGRMQKWDFCISVCKTNFTGHHTPNTIDGFGDSVLVCKMHSCMIHKNFELFHSFPSSDASDYNGYNIKRDRFQMLSNVFSTTYTYSNCIVY